MISTFTTLLQNLNEVWFKSEIVICFAFQVEFVSAQGATTNHVECFWKNAKAKFKRMNGVDGDHLTSYLKEFMWFKVTKYVEKTLFKSDWKLNTLQRNGADPHTRILEAISQRHPTPWGTSQMKQIQVNLTQKLLSSNRIWKLIQIWNIETFDRQDVINSESQS